MNTHPGQDDSVDFSVAVSMRGPAAHLAVRGTLDEEATRTLEDLVGRLPGAADITEVVVDITEADADAPAVDALAEAIVAAAPTSLGVTITEPAAPDSSA